MQLYNNLLEHERVPPLPVGIEAGPAAGMEMFLRAKGGGVFNDYYDDGSRWTEAQARDVAGHIICQTQQDAEFVETALARLAIP